ncbi:unnamed protein product [Notodromas monacha]|uniref:Conserved oligomeric Golgi complex subunit 4 C-terminal domain-containing protein n=1 Tax=Notodromas monacha TaxID=399045 RepID=A0A7R9BGG0_9CRUS|nr:unnamed protein product [Notodromas monacha]CAG0913418.1 unnamed protein product [Notodromas monacha]
MFSTSLLFDVLTQYVERSMKIFKDLLMSILLSLMDLGMDQVKAAVVQPRVRPWVEGFIGTNYNISDDEFSDYEANDPFVHEFIANLDALLMSFKNSLTPGNYDILVVMLTGEVTTQLEKAVMKKTFNRLGGLRLDKEIRALVAYLSSMCTWGVREKFSRLTQISTLLNMERLTEVSEFWTSRPDSVVRLMSPSQVKLVLELRDEFKPEEVRKLVL